MRVILRSGKEVIVQKASDLLEVCSAYVIVIRGRHQGAVKDPTFTENHFQSCSVTHDLSGTTATRSENLVSWTELEGERRLRKRTRCRLKLAL